MKACTKCGEAKPLSEFRKSKLGQYGLHSHCKLCHKAYREANKDQSKSTKLKSKYGINLSDYNDMLAVQNGACAICNNPESARARNGKSRTFLSVDHDHKTGAVRGLLCHNCNVALGLIRDNEMTALKMYKYLAPMGGLEHLFEIKQIVMAL